MKYYLSDFLVQNISFIDEDNGKTNKTEYLNYISRPDPVTDPCQKNSNIKTGDQKIFLFLILRCEILFWCLLSFPVISLPVLVLKYTLLFQGGTTDFLQSCMYEEVVYHSCIFPVCCTFLCLSFQLSTIGHSMSEDQVANYF